MDIKKTGLFTRPIAHRGLHNSELPENSLGAFENAIKRGFPIEMDLRITDDGEVIVFHDDTLSRMSRRDGYVGKMPWKMLKDIKLFNSDGELSDCTIPTFEQFLQAVDGRVPILVEIKNKTACGPLEKRVIEMLHGYRGEYAVQSFSPYSLEYFKLNAFEIPRGQLSGRFTRQDLSGAFKRYVLRKLRMLKTAQPDFISYQFDELPKEFVTKTKLPVLAWTVRNQAEYRRVMPYCDNIIFENFIPEAVEKGENTENENAKGTID